MSINILGGRLKGLPLFCPDTLDLRPTSVILRRKIFDANQSMEGRIFIDACAGIGSMGIEALSRGADHAVFIEKHAETAKVLKENIRQARSRDESVSSESYKKDILKWLPYFFKEYAESTNKEDYIIFLDPPYEKVELYASVISLLKENQFIGTLWVEACRQKTMSSEKLEEMTGKFDKLYKQGTSYLGVKDFSQ